MLHITVICQLYLDPHSIVQWFQSINHEYTSHHTLFKLHSMDTMRTEKEHRHYLQFLRANKKPQYYCASIHCFITVILTKDKIAIHIVHSVLQAVQKYVSFRSSYARPKTSAV